MTVEEALNIQQGLVNAYEGSNFYDKPMYSQIFEAEKVSIEALEKQIPLKLDTSKSMNGYGNCPVCNNSIEYSEIGVGFKFNYCPNCGQRLE